MVTMSSSQWFPWQRGSYLVDTCVAVCLLLASFPPPAIADRVFVSPYGSMTPSNPLAESGTTLQLNCTLTDNAVDNLGYNVSNIYFKFASLPIPGRYLTIVDEHTVMLNYPNVQRNHSGHWFCYLPSVNNDIKVGEQAVVIADRPVKPNITRCVVYNWENMTCYWEPKTQDTGLATNQTLYWTLSIYSTKPPYFLCPNTASNTCTWKSVDSRDSLKIGIYVMYMEATNSIGTVITEALPFHTYNIVKPNPVKQLKVEDEGSYHIYLSWQAPVEQKRILYRVLYRAEKPANGVWQERNVNTKKEMISMNITGLTPYMTYIFNITCKPGSLKGFWSLPKLIIHSTNEDVPAAAPALPTGAFHISSFHDDASKRKVDILWQSIPERMRNGEIIKYRFRYGEKLDGSERIKEIDPTPNNVLSLILDKGKAYTVVIDAKTRKGYNNSLLLEPLFIAKETNLPPKPKKFVPIALEDKLVFLNWTAIEDSVGYTVFWCKGSSQFSTCDTEMEWTVLDENITSYNVTLGNDDSRKFIFGISSGKIYQKSRQRRELSSKIVSSGIKWSDCTYDINKPVIRPKMAVSEHQEPLSITLEWVPPYCSNTIYIDYYLIFYCRADDPQCTEDGKCEENSSIKKIQVDSSFDEYTIKGAEHQLEPAQYRVWMCSFSSYKSHNQSLSTPTSTQLVTVYQSGPTKPVIAVICIVGIIVVFFILFGLYQGYKTCQRKVKEEVNVKIERPPEVATHITDRRFDDDQNIDYMMNYNNIVDQDQQLSEEKCLIRENQANQQREHPHPNGDINARARMYLGGNQSAELMGKYPEDTALMPLQQYNSGDTAEEEKISTDRGLPDTPNKPAGLPSTPKQNSQTKDRPAPVSKQKPSSGNGQPSVGSVIPSYSKCGLPEEETKGEPIYQTVTGEEHQESEESSPHAGEIKEECPIQEPSPKQKNNNKVPSYQQDVMPAVPNPTPTNAGYAAWTDDAPVNGFEPGSGGSQQGSSSFSPYCQIISPSEYKNSTVDASPVPKISVTDYTNYTTDNLPCDQAKASQVAQNNLDYQQVQDAAMPVPINQSAEELSEATLQTDVDPSCLPPTEPKPLNIANNNNGYVTVHM